MTRDCKFIDDNLCKWMEKSFVCQSMDSINICRDDNNYCKDMDQFLDLCRDENNRSC